MIKISKAKPTEAREITLVRYKIWLNTYPNKEYNITEENIKDHFREKISLAGIKEAEEKISSLGNNSSFLVIKDDDKIVGFCQAIKDREENKLGSLYILPEYQRRGLGKMLWQELLKFFNPKSRIYVEVASYNFPAISFYKSLGFEDTSRRLDFRLKDGKVIPVIEMVLKFNKW